MAQKRSRLQLKLEYYAARGLVEMIGLLPLKTSLKTGARFGRAFQRFVPKLNRIGRRNLEIALPDLSESEKRRILRGTFENLGRQLGLFAHFKNFTRDNLHEVVEFEGREHFERAELEKRGALLLTAHFGGWELINAAMSSFGFPGNILVRRIDNPLIEQFVEELRAKFGSRTIDKKTSARTMFRLLQSGERLGIVADQNAQPHEAVFVDFFGVPAATTASVARLALRTNAVVLPAFAIWLDDKQKYLFKVEPPIEIEKTGETEIDVQNLTQAATRRIENLVRQYPEQWLWIHKRWNTRPTDEPNFYV